MVEPLFGTAPLTRLLSDLAINQLEAPHFSTETQIHQAKKKKLLRIGQAQQGRAGQGRKEQDTAGGVGWMTADSIMQKQDAVSARDRARVA